MEVMTYTSTSQQGAFEMISLHLLSMRHNMRDLQVYIRHGVKRRRLTCVTLIIMSGHSSWSCLTARTPGNGST